MYDGYVALMSLISDSEHSSYEEVEEQQVWKYEMIEEYQSIFKSDVQDVVPRLEGKSIVTCRWIYKINHVAYGSVDKYKSRFVDGGFSQKEGIYYEETFSLVARYTTIRAMISLASILG